MCDTTNYLPAVFTCYEDGTVGVELDGSTTSPSQYENDAFYFFSGDWEFRNVRFSHFSYPIVSEGGSLTFRNAQFIDSTVVFETGSVEINIFNGLFKDCAMIYEGGAPNFLGEHVTVDNTTVFGYSYSPETTSATLKNSLLYEVTDDPPAYAGNYIPSATESPTSPPFDTPMEGGGYYLSSASSLRNVNTDEDIDSALQNELSEMTTHAPALLTGTPSVDIVLAPSVARDVSTIGYHYPVLDHIVKDLALENTSLTIKGGAVIGVAVDANSVGVSLQPGKLVSIGTATRPNHFVRLNQVQENAVDRVPTMVSSGADDEFAPELTARFTEFSSLAGEADLITMGDEFARMELSHSALINGNLAVDMNPGNDQIVGLTNTLFQSVVSTFTGDATASLYAYNNLFKDGEFNVTGANSAWRVYDNVFDHATVSDTGSGAQGGKNAYVPSTADQLSFDSAPEPLTSLTYVSGPLGRYYISGTTLEDLGSRDADDAGLYHFTTQASLESIEEDSAVDIGLHYVSLAANGFPYDTDADGLPDYFEDANGNGSFDSADDWGNWTVLDCPFAFYETVIDRQNYDSKLKGWFRLNDEDSHGLDNEVSGHASLDEGSSIGGFANDVFASGNGAYSFSATTDKLTLTETDGNDPIGGGEGDSETKGSFTLLFRALPEAASGIRYLLSQGTDNGRHEIGVYFDGTSTSPGPLKLRVGKDSAGQALEPIILPSDKIAFGAWYYLAVTCDQTRPDNQVRWYLGRVGSGTLDSDSFTLTGTYKVFGNNGPITVGNKGSVSGSNAYRQGSNKRGYIDQVTFWERELTQPEVSDQFYMLNMLQEGPSTYFDLTHWNLLSPVPDTDSTHPLEISTAWLNSGFKHVDPADCTAKYFYRDGSTMVFKTPYDGAHSGTGGPRSELRETNPDGSEHNWIPGSGGTHILKGKCRVDVAGDGKIAIGQIHADTPLTPDVDPPHPNPDGAVPAIILYYDNRTDPENQNDPNKPYLKVSVYDSPTRADPDVPADGNVTHYEIFNKYNMPTDKVFDYELKIVASSTSCLLYVTVNGVHPAAYPIDMAAKDPLWYKTAPEHPVPFDPEDDATSLYFKAGCYYPEFTGSGVTAQVTFFSLEVKHE